MHSTNTSEFTMTKEKRKQNRKYVQLILELMRNIQVNLAINIGEQRRNKMLKHYYILAVLQNLFIFTSYMFKISCPNDHSCVQNKLHDKTHIKTYKDNLNADKV